MSQVPAQSEPAETRQGGAFADWRRWLLGLFVIGCVGAIADLLLLGHTEEVWQWIPVALLGAGIPVAAAVFRATSIRIRVLRILLCGYILAGLIGAFLHMKGNAEFEKELNPAIGVTTLIGEVLTGAFPAVAPLQMIHLALLGLLACFRHPVLSSKN